MLLTSFQLRDLLQAHMRREKLNQQEMGELHCFCRMRSNDIWLGTPHNSHMFCFLQRALAGWLGVKAGLYTHCADSMHIYEEHIERAEKMLRDPRLNEIPEVIEYPKHSYPEITYFAIERFLGWERGARTEKKFGFETCETYEAIAAAKIVNFLSPKP